jgi:hypothetical protein
MTKREIFETLNSLPFDFQICGSLGLKMMGIITREIGDIDIVAPNPDYKFLEKYKCNYSGSGDELCITVNINGIRIDVWHKNGSKFEKMSNNFGTYKVELPEYAIKAKQGYISEFVHGIAKNPDMHEVYGDKLKKHVDDLLTWANWKSR